MDTKEAVRLRKILENDITALLLKYKDATGLTPVSLDVKTEDVSTLGANRCSVILSVRVTVTV